MEVTLKRQVWQILITFTSKMQWLKSFSIKLVRKSLKFRENPRNISVKVRILQFLMKKSSFSSSNPLKLSSSFHLLAIPIENTSTFLLWNPKFAKNISSSPQKLKYQQTKGKAHTLAFPLSISVHTAENLSLSPLRSASHPCFTFYFSARSESEWERETHTRDENHSIIAFL